MDLVVLQATDSVRARSWRLTATSCRHPLQSGRADALSPRKGVRPGWQTVLMTTDGLRTVQQELRTFASDRSWERFHTPKNLVLALTGEVGELAAELQWLTEDEADQLRLGPPPEVRDELADVFIYLVRLADVLGVDLVDVAMAKIARNADRFPASNLETGEHP